MNKTKAFLITLFMGLVSQYVCAHSIEVANAQGVTIYYNWTNNQTELTVTYKGSDYSSFSNEYSGDIIIPSSVTYNENTYPVTGINSSAFRDCTSLQSINFPSSLVSIGSYAFAGCSSLQSIDFPQSLVSIGIYAFAGCSSLQSIDFPQSLVSIGNYAFAGCSGIQSAPAIPLGCTLGNQIFINCTGLTVVSLKKLGSGMFTGCTAIETINSYIEEPTAISLFDSSIYSTATLNVPIGRSDAYKSKDYWKRFTHIVEGNWGSLADLYQTITITVTTPGHLAEELASLTTQYFTKLTIQGPLNAADISALRSPEKEIVEVKELDLSNVTLVSGEDAYATFAGKPDDGLLNSGYTYNFYISDTNHTDVVSSGNTHVYNVYSNCLAEFLDFSINSNLLPVKKVVMPEGITEVGDWAFRSSKVEEVELPTAVTKFGQKAFYYSKLATLTADLSNLTEFSISTVEGTPWLTNLLVEGNIKYAGNIAVCLSGIPSGALVFKEGTTIIADKFSSSAPSYSYRPLSAVTSVEFPSTLKVIGARAFTPQYSGDNLSCPITIPEGVVSIGDGAFSNNTTLTSVSLPSTLETIGTQAFYYCPITSVNIGAHVTTIGDYAFQYCNLSSVTIPSTVTYVGNGAFSNNTLLTTVSIDVPELDMETTEQFAGNTSLVNLTIGSHVKNLTKNMFKGCTALTEITIPANVETLGLRPFEDCSALETLRLNQKSVTGKIIASQGAYLGAKPNTTVTTVILGNTVETIEQAAFDSFTALESVNIPSSVTSIGAYAFYGCTSLASALTIPDAITELPTEVFRNCTSLTSVTLPAQMTSIGHGCFNNCRLTAITIPEGLTEIAPYTFYYNQFESVEIPEGVTTIGEGAFRACLNLETVTLPSTLETIGEEAFVGNNMIEALTIPANVTLGTKAFYCSTHLTDLNLGEGVVVGNEAFENCYALGTLSIPNNVQIGEKGFYNCTSLETVTTGNGVRITGVSAFVNCPITSLTLGKNAYVYMNAFEECPIGILTLSEGADLWKDAFKGNTQLQSLHVPTNVQIRDNVFDGCTSLASLVFERNNKNLGSKTFTGCPITSIRLLDASEDTYDYLLQFNKGTIYAPFDNTTYENAVLTVPGGSKQLFSDPTRSKWSDFTNIQEEADTDISELDNTIYIESVEGYTGRQLTLSVKMKNTVEAEGFQFDLYLPDGVTFAKDTNNRPIASLSTARTTAAKTNSFSAAIQSNGALRVIAASTNGSVISGTDGEVAKVIVNISNEIDEGDYSLILKNIAISEHNSSGSYNVDYVKSTLTITTAPYILGDANGDGNVNVSDFTAIAHHILGNTPSVFSIGAADANQDGIVNVADLTAVAHLILYGTIERPNAGRQMNLEEYDSVCPD